MSERRASARCRSSRWARRARWISGSRARAAGSRSCTSPRTPAGVDAVGRTVLVAADGRGTDALGLSIGESAEVAKALGLRDAVNLDGGGSTTMAADGRVINDPSDAAGERPVGDALLLLPHRN